MALVTTSRRPTKRTRSFVKELTDLIPSSVRINRGKLSLRGLVAEAVAHRLEKIVVVNTYRGNPGSIDIYRVCVKRGGESSIEIPTQDLVDAVLVTRILLRGVRLTREGPGIRCGHIKRYRIESSGCGEEACREVVDALRELFGESPDAGDQGLYTVSISREEGLYRVSLRRPDGADCGPLITVSRVLFYERLCPESSTLTTASSR